MRLRASGGVRLLAKELAMVKKLRRSKALWLLLFAASLQAQGVLTYPDILYYKFNEGSGQNVINWANPGASSYQPVWANGVPGIYNTTSPQFGAACMNFAGLARLLTNYPTNLQQNFTIEMWIRLNVVCPTACGLQRLWGDYQLSFFRCYVGFNNLGSYYNGGGFPALAASTATVNDGAWHHIALVHDFTINTITSYVDGNVDQVGTYSPTVGLSSSANANFGLGGTGTVTSITGLPFNGCVDEFRYWGEARSQAQIQAGMLGELPETATRALFGASTRSGPSHLLVAFQDLSSSVNGGVTAWFWDFGDGTQSSLQNPCHVYTAPGNYTVSLTVADALTFDSITIPNYISVGQQTLTVASCGQGDLYLATPAPPVGWMDGFTFLSLATTAPRGLGWFFGLYPDLYTFTVLGLPPAPGNPLHFTNVGNPALFPDAPLNFPPGSFANLAGLVMDTVVVYRDAAGVLLNWTTVSRARF